MNKKIPLIFPPQTPMIQPCSPPAPFSYGFPLPKPPNPVYPKRNNSFCGAHTAHTERYRAHNVKVCAVSLDFNATYEKNNPKKPTMAQFSRVRELAKSDFSVSSMRAAKKRRPRLRFSRIPPKYAHTAQSMRKAFLICILR
jgi:hypothetical protein